jgi:hypothetical protein
MKKTLIFLTVYPFNDDYAKKYGFNYLKGRGYDITILNIMAILYPHAINELPGYTKLESVEGVEQKKIETKKQFDEALRAIKSKKIAFLICQPEREILDSLRQDNTNYIIFKNHEQQHVFSSIAERLVKIFYNRNPIRTLFKKSKNKITLSLRKFFTQADDSYDPIFIIARNNKTKFSIDANNTKTSILYVNSFDYDRVLEQQNLEYPKYLREKQYHVLLVNHPWPIHDSILSKTNSFIDPQSYTLIINRFLDLLEKKTDKKVMIAAYPKATEKENIYNGRPFIYDTEQLVKYSSGVIGHHTGAMNFAVIHNKPICLIGLKYFPKYSDFTMENKHFSKELGVPLHYIDTEEDVHDLLKGEIFSIKHKSYREYMQKNVLSEFNSNKKIWETVSEALEGKRLGIKI